MRLVPLPEGGGVDLDDGALHEGVGPDELVVGCVVNLINDKHRHHEPQTSIISPTKPWTIVWDTHDADETSLLRHMLAAPRKVARIEAERAVLEAAAAHAHGVDPLHAELRSRSLATELELALFAVVCALRARGGTLVTGFTSNT